MEGVLASLRAKNSCNETVHSTTLFYYLHRGTPACVELSLSSACDLQPSLLPYPEQDFEIP